MRHETELRVQVQQPNDSEPQWYSLDIGSGNTLTLDYVSNLLSDVSKIDSGRSFTVKLPRTRRNDTAFDLAVVPQHQSQRPYRYLPCRVYVDGIDVSDEAYMYLVSAEASTYNAVIVFGLMQEYKAWVDAGKTIKELDDGGQSVPWSPASANEPTGWYGSDPNIDTYTPQNGLGKLMYYGIYNPGFERDGTTIGYANVHPFVTMREILERIISENSLNFIFPSFALLDMEDLAIVLTTKSGNTPQGNLNNDYGTLASRPYSVRKSMAVIDWYWNVICSTSGECYENGEQNYNYGNRKSRILYKGDGKALDLSVYISLNDNSLFSYNGGNYSVSQILNDKGHMSYMNLCVYIYSTGETKTITPVLTNSFGTLWQGNIHIPCPYAQEGEAVADVWIINDSRICNDVGNNIWSTYWFGGNRTNWDMLFSWNQNFRLLVKYYTGSHDYPNPAFRCFPNLPDIKQLDFVKMVCHLYGLFPCQRAGVVEFIPIDELELNKPKAYDWSRYLLEDDPDAPHHTDWHMTDLARRNRASYKEDDKDLVVDEAWLTVDDDTLDPLKDFFTIPLAASDGDTINQYSITPVYDDSTDPPTLTGYKAEFTECEHRLMRVVEWYNGEKNVTRLAFQNLSSAQIIAERYGAYQSYVNQPRIVTERLRVPLADLQTLDYSKPVFLSKYGKYFAIIDIKWTVTQDTCESKFLML